MPYTFKIYSDGTHNFVLALPAGAIVYWCMRKKLLVRKYGSKPTEEFGKGNGCMTKDEIRKICEKRFAELGAKKIELQPSGECWTLNGDFFKVTTLQNQWVLEWTDNRSYASNYGFEDADLMPYDISEAEVLEQVNSLLQK